MSQFALLYSDRVYIRNFFSDSIDAAGECNLSEDRVRQIFAEECALLTFIRPLIEAGHVIPFTPNVWECPVCSLKYGAPTSMSKKLHAQRNRLARRYLDEVQFTLLKSTSGYTLAVRGPEELVAHGAVEFSSASVPSYLRSHPKLLAQVEQGKPLVFSKRLRALSGLPEQWATDVQCDLGFELTAADRLSTAFLTEQELHVNSLNEILGDHELVRKNQLAQQHLTAILPFVTDVSLSDLLTLRRREEESFVLYRRELNKALAEYQATSRTFTENDARHIYQEFIAPSVARIERSVKLAKRDLIRTPARKGAGMFAALSFGIYSGFLPPSFTAAATAIGGGKFVADLTEQWLQTRDVQRSVRSDPMYFLWRVAKLAKGYNPS